MPVVYRLNGVRAIEPGTFPEVSVARTFKQQAEDDRIADQRDAFVADFRRDPRTWQERVIQNAPAEVREEIAAALDEEHCTECGDELTGEECIRRETLCRECRAREERTFDSHEAR